MAHQTKVESLAERLCWEVRELSLGSSGEIERIQGAPTSLRFLREFVLPNKPCIITNAIDHWPALKTWTNSYLRASLANQWVSVHSTPNGFADAVVDLDHLVPDKICTILPGSCHALAAEHARTFSSNGPGDGASCDAHSASHHVLEKESLVDAHSRISASGECEAISLDDADKVYGNGTAVNCTRCTALKHEEDDNVSLLLLPSHNQKPSSLDASGVYEEVCSLKMESLDKAACDDGYGFEPKEESPDRAWFVTAHVERVPFSTALHMILHSEVGRGVAYAQEQNGCFLSEYSVLSADAEMHLPWATEAFGCLPEAVNLWIGNEKAVTSFHKDHYENLYAVIAGEKHFTLLPPTDVHRLYIRHYPSAHYVKHESEFAIVQEKPLKFVPWASVDPYPAAEVASESKCKFPEYFNGPKPFTCTLRAGEILYLPSLWFHHVRQSPDLEGRTIALNFWYDMQFDIKYAYYNFLESLILKTQLHAKAESGASSHDDFGLDETKSS